MALAGIAATLLGLLFVGLAINPAVMQDHSPDGMRTWAGLTFHNFLIELAIALVVLIPEQSAEGLAIPIGIMCAHGVYRVARDIHGGNGILLEHHVGRFVADAEAIYSYEGTREVNTLIVGRAVIFGAAAVALTCLTRGLRSVVVGASMTPGRWFSIDVARLS